MPKDGCTSCLKHMHADDKAKSKKPKKPKPDHPHPREATATDGNAAEHASSTASAYAPAHTQRPARASPRSPTTTLAAASSY